MDSQLKPVVILHKRGEEAYISLRELLVSLKWTAAVDLDLMAFYRTTEGRVGAVYYAEKGSLTQFPFMALDEDMGVGDVAGDNEENLRIAKLDGLSDVLIVTSLYNKPDSSFSEYDGFIILTTDVGDNIQVPLNATEEGQWCIIAHLDNNNEATGPKLVNVNRVQAEQPDINKFR